MITLEAISTLVSLLIAVISLVISLIALKVSQRTYLFSSKEYPPDIQFEINDKDDLTIIHNSTDLFSINTINFLKFRTIGYEDHDTDSVVQVSFIVKSDSHHWIEHESRAKRVKIKADQGGACAYICQYDSEMVKAFREKIDQKYPFGGEHGFAPPSLQSRSYVVEVIYTDKFQERKSAIYLMQHLHGYGYDKLKITEDRFDALLKRSDIPKFQTLEELWTYVNKNYRTPAARFYGG